MHKMNWTSLYSSVNILICQYGRTNASANCNSFMDYINTGLRFSASYSPYGLTPDWEPAQEEVGSKYI